MKIERSILSTSPLHVRVTFSNDTDFAVLDSDDLSPAVLAELLAYGMGRNPNDKTAGEKNEDDKMAGIKAVIQDLKAGVTSKRASGSSAADKVADATQKLAAFAALDKTVQQAMESMKMGKAYLEAELAKAIKAQTKLAEKAAKTK